MKNFLVAVGLFVAVGGAMALSSVALGASKYSAALTSSDAGQTNTATLARNVSYELICANPACYKTGTSTLSVDCATDRVVNGGLSGSTPIELVDGGTGSGTSTLNPLVVRSGNSVAAGYTTGVIASGADTKLAAKALDAGDPNCLLYQVTTNPPAYQ